MWYCCTPVYAYYTDYLMYRCMCTADTDLCCYMIPLHARLRILDYVMYRCMCTADTHLCCYVILLHARLRILYYVMYRCMCTADTHLCCYVILLYARYAYYTDYVVPAPTYYARCFALQYYLTTNACNTNTKCNPCLYAQPLRKIIENQAP
jgi:hypothetical protein